MVKKKEVDPRDKLKGYYKSVFNGAKGKVILHDMMVNCGMFQSSYVPNDSHGTAFNEGKRDFILYILRLLNKDKEDFLEKSADMQEDYNNEFS